MHIKALLHANSFITAAKLYRQYFIAPSVSVQQFSQYTDVFYLIVLKLPLQCTLQK